MTDDAPAGARSPRTFLPATGGAPWALSLYDPLTRWLGADRVRREMLAGVALPAGVRVLDVGCGTGTLLVDVGRAQPSAVLLGLDPDERILARARSKLERAGLRATLDQGYADALPYADASIDRVLSSFMLHHLARPQKEAMLREVRRVLTADGTFHLLDIVGAAHRHGMFGHGRGHVAHEGPEEILALLGSAGFAQVRREGERRRIVGTLAWFAAGP